MDLAKNKKEIFAQVREVTERAGRKPSEVTIIAVTKYVDEEVTRDLVNTGIQHIGENRVDKFLAKYEALKDQNLTWHLIGTLQRRKVKEVINYVDYFHALDSLKLAQEINKRADKIIKCFLQVNISGEESKHGFSAEEVEEILPELEKLDKLELVGLMTMAPFEADEATLADIFHKTQQLNQKLRRKEVKNMPFSDLSMGMSRDYPQAIENGATYIRIGTAFFE